MWQGKDAGLLCGDKELLSVVSNCENHRMEEVEEDGIEDWVGLEFRSTYSGDY